jgi:hypothetical protein
MLLMELLEGLKIKYRQNGKWKLVIKRLSDESDQHKYNILVSDPTIIGYEIDKKN